MDKTQLAREKIIRARIQLIIHRPFFGVLALGLELVEYPECKTIATDGEHLFFNSDFMLRQTPEFCRTLIAHEVTHCVLGHIWREGTREHEKWNIATDHADNLLLKQDGFAIPDWMYCDENFSGMEAEAIYAKLPDEKAKDKHLADSHEKWSGTRKSKDKNEGAANDPKKPDKPESQTGSNPDAPGQSNEKRLEKEWKERTVRAAQEARRQGKLTGTQDRLIQDILQPKIDWRSILCDLLASCIKNDFRLFPPSKKHLWRELFLPSMTGETLEIAVGVDTSGSVSEHEFQVFLAEVRGIAEQFGDYIIHLFLCDAAIQLRLELTPEDGVLSVFPKRDGGTNFIPVFQAIHDEELRVSALVYLTDGAGTYPEYPPEYPVIWVMNTKKKPPWGEVVRIEKGAL